MSQLEKALQFALYAHGAQVDKSGQPYIAHIMGVWSRVRDDEETIQVAALLHDVVEDTNTDLEVIRSAFGERVANAVGILTHAKGTDYTEYIQNIGTSPDATKVKLADLADNTDSTRFFRLPTKDQIYFRDRIRLKYKPAIEYLHEAQRARRVNGGRMV
jgi:(p)ppGpp synthase/HD superfamily hydrolase